VHSPAGVCEPVPETDKSKLADQVESHDLADPADGPRASVRKGGRPEEEVAHKCHYELQYMSKMTTNRLHTTGCKVRVDCMREAQVIIQ